MFDSSIESPLGEHPLGVPYSVGLFITVMPQRVRGEKINFSRRKKKTLFKFTFQTYIGYLNGPLNLFHQTAHRLFVRSHQRKVFFFKFFI